MAKLYNLARMTTATTGTGDVVLSQAVRGYLSFAAAGLQDGEVFSYVLKENNNHEVGRGLYTAATNSFTRSVLKSTNNDATISLAGRAEVAITALAEDFVLSPLTGLGAGITEWLSDPSSANLRTAVTDATGTGALVFAESPQLVTPEFNSSSATTSPFISENLTQAASVKVGEFQNTRTAPATNDTIYRSDLMTNSALAQVEMAREEIKATSVSSGNESAEWRQHLRKNGVLTDLLTLTGSALAPSTNEGLTFGTASAAWLHGYFTNIQLGNASDTTLSRYSAGVPAVEGWPLQLKGGAFSGHLTMVTNSAFLTGWPSGIAYQASEDRVWVFQMEMPTHGLSTSGTQLDSRLVAWYTDDHGITREGLRTVYSDPDKRIIAGAIGNMASGRIGGIITCSADATTTTNRVQFFIYSDDNCETWTWVELTGLTVNHFVYGMLMALPAAYGGHATNGFAVVTYAGTTEAKLIKTTDNGSNWTEVVPLLDGDLTITNPQEPSLVFTSAGAIMFARAGGSLNLFAAKSTDLVTWSSWVNTGIALGDNPVHAVVDADDFVHIAICDREDFTGAVTDNVMRTYRIAGATLYADLTALSSVTAVKEWILPNRGLGYMQSMRVDDQWYHLIKIRESIGSQTGYAQDGAFGIITTSKKPSANVVSVQTSPRQIVHNPDFSIWNNGTSFLNLTTSEETADRWFYSPSGSTGDVTQVTLTEKERLMFPHRPRYGIKIDTLSAGNVHSDFAGIIQYHQGEQFHNLLRVLQANSEIAFFVYGKGTAIPSARLLVYIDYGTGGSADVSISGTLTKAYTNGGGSYVQTVRLRGPIIGNPTIGTNPTIWIVLDCSSSATAFEATIVGIFGYVGGAPYEPQAPDSIENMLTCALADTGTDTAGTVTFHRPLSVGTSYSITAGTIKLGVASDTTISRVSAGRIAVEGSNVLMASDIGVTVQGYDADLASWAGVTRASGFDTFVANPSSANLAALVTGETGNGALVFATSPTLVTAVATSTVTSTAAVQAINTSDAASVRGFRIDGSRATPTAGDIVYMSFFLNNSVGAAEEAGRISAYMTDITSSSEDASLLFGVVINSSITNMLRLTGTTLQPMTTDTLSLGSATVMWSDLFLASGAVINFNNGDVSLTHAADTLAMTGGNMIFGHTAAVSIAGITPQVQTHGTTAASTTFANIRWANVVGGSGNTVGKSRGGSIGTHTIVDADDVLGFYNAVGSDGSAFIVAGTINFEVDGTPGLNAMPGRLVFKTTATGAASPTERMRIDKGGNVVVGTAALGTTATDGFLYVPTCAGAPTGVPTAYTGRVPLVFDTTNNKLYAYDGGWISATFA